MVQLLWLSFSFHMSPVLPNILFLPSKALSLPGRRSAGPKVLVSVCSEGPPPFVATRSSPRKQSLDFRHFGAAKLNVIRLVSRFTSSPQCLISTKVFPLLCIRN